MAGTNGGFQRGDKALGSIDGDYYDNSNSSLQIGGYSELEVEETKPAGIAYQILDLRSPVIGLIALAVIGAFLALQTTASQPQDVRFDARRTAPQALRSLMPARQIDATLILVDDPGQELVQLQLLQERDEVRAQWKEEPAQVSIVNVGGFSEEQVTLLIAGMDAERSALGLTKLVVEDWRVH